MHARCKQIALDQLDVDLLTGFKLEYGLTRGRLVTVYGKTLILYFFLSNALTIDPVSSLCIHSRLVSSETRA